MKNKNQDRIEKLKGLATTNEDDQHKPHVASKNIDHVIKLNEELTAENSRLLERCDELEGIIRIKVDSIEHWKYTNRVLEDRLHKAKQSETELSEIKSKWWYKLMTWEWK